MHNRINKLVILIASALFLGNVDAASVDCPSADIFGTGFVNNICWGCIAPIRIGGIDMPMTFGSLPSGTSKDDQMPSGSYNSGGVNTFCACGETVIEKAANIGTPVSYYEPFMLVEFVKRGYCSPILAGATLGGVNKISTNGANSRGSETFYDYHTVYFPVLRMLELFLDPGCDTDGLISPEVGFFSEVDPLWEDEILSMFTTPEALLFNTPVANLACTTECMQQQWNIFNVSTAAFWCAGCWGNVYPNAGYVESTRINVTSLLTARVLANWHLRRVLKKTYGDKSMCTRETTRYVPKEQYKISMVYPDPEINSSHAIGSPSLRWGESRNKMGPGENHVYLLYRYVDCCTGIAQFFVNTP